MVKSAAFCSQLRLDAEAGDGLGLRLAGGTR